MQCVRHLGMELHAKETALFVFHCCQRRIRTARGYVEARRRLLDAVAMAHPHLEHRLTALRITESAEKVGITRRDFGIAKFPMCGGFNLAAEFGRERDDVLRGLHERNVQ